MSLSCFGSHFLISVWLTHPCLLPGLRQDLRLKAVRRSARCKDLAKIGHTQIDFHMLKIVLMISVISRGVQSKQRALTQIGVQWDEGAASVIATWSDVSQS